MLCTKTTTDGGQYLLNIFCMSTETDRLWTGMCGSHLWMVPRISLSSEASQWLRCQKEGNLIWRLIFVLSFSQKAVRVRSNNEISGVGNRHQAFTAGYSPIPQCFRSCGSASCYPSFDLCLFCPLHACSAAVLRIFSFGNLCRNPQTVLSFT